MADLEEITENRRADEERDSNNGDNSDVSYERATKRKRSRKRRKYGGSGGSVRSRASGEDLEGQGEQTSRGQDVQNETDGERGATLNQEDYQAQFYKHYRKVAGAYDRDFLKRYDEDLNTTLIFAGLFSAVTAAFIIEINSQLQPDPNDETAALLRVLIYKIDNTTFGDHVPNLPQWTGPSRMVVQVQSILFASLAVSLFSAFLAMLGKQWINRYDSSDMRGTAIERGRNRQRKLDGIISWYFNSVMESLPLMLQVALLLLGCALSRYLWEINITIASVVLGVTSFGLTFYIFIIIAATVSEDCPYQTPGSYILRNTILPSVSSASDFIRKSVTADLFAKDLERIKGPLDFILFLLCIPLALALDIYHFGRAISKFFRVLRRTISRWIINTSPPTLSMDQKVVALDLRCISWTIQTSLDKAIHSSTLKYLAEIPQLSHFDPTLIVGCFNAFVGCLNTSGHAATIIPNFEELASLSVQCLLRAIHHLSTADPTSNVLVDFRQRYNVNFPAGVNFMRLPCQYATLIMQILFDRNWSPRSMRWNEDNPSTLEHIILSRYVESVVQRRHLDQRKKRVPRWALRFVLRSFSLPPLPSTSVILSCLKIIAIDLRCDLPGLASFDENEQVERVSGIISQKLEVMVEANDRDSIISGRKAISTLIPYAMASQQEKEQQRLVNGISRTARASKSHRFGWYWSYQHTTVLSETPSSPSSDRAIVLLSPFLDWDGPISNGSAVVRWAGAVSRVAYTEEVGQNMIDTLLQIMDNKHLLPHVPNEILAWLNRRPTLPPVCFGRYVGGRNNIERIRRFCDIETLKSYFLLVWSEWDDRHSAGFRGMETSIMEDFSGTWMRHHRKDLLERLGHVIEQLDRGVEHLKQHQPEINAEMVRRRKTGYQGLREVLLEVDREEVPMTTLIQSHLTFVCSFPYP